MKLSELRTLRHKLNNAIYYSFEKLNEDDIRNLQESLQHIDDLIKKYDTEFEEELQNEA